MPRYRQADRLARYRKRQRAGFQVVISEGDSWFSYEFFPNIIDLLEDDELLAILRLEMSGDTVANMIGDAETIESLRELAVMEKALFLLFSGGGNDIQMTADRLFRDADTAEECLVPEVMEELFPAIRSRYEELIRSVGPTVPVVGHGYDYFPPVDEPVRFLGIDIRIGPWIHPEMVKAGIEDPALQREIAVLLVDRFNADLTTLQDAHPRDFVHVDLRGTLDPEKDWENEIHPTRKGFRKVSKKIVQAIRGPVRSLLIERSAP